MASLAADPTIRRQVLSAARETLRDDPRSPVGRIATRAGVSRATFYRHFGSRDALLREIDWADAPDARTRILAAASEMLVSRTLATISMEQLARAAGVSRGTLYRLFPGKPALLRAMVEAYAPFHAMLEILETHGHQPPRTVLPMIARAVVGAAGRRLGLLRAIFHEATSGSDMAMTGVRPSMEVALGALAGYVTAQMAAGTIRPMHSLLALQLFIGPIFFHLMTRPVAERVFEIPMSPESAVDLLVDVTLAGLEPVR